MKTTEQERIGAVEKCRAVLTVWTERQQAATLCRDMGISAALFSQWQDRALSGMLAALEPRGTRAGTDGPALSELVKRLLDRKVRAQELATVGRLVLGRPRMVRSKEPPPAPAAPAAS